MAKFWRHAFYSLAVTLIAIFVYLLLQGRDGQFLALLAAFMCLVAARFDDIAKFKLSKDGLEGEMRQVLDEAKATLEQLHSVAETQSRMILWSMQAHGRWGGFDFDSQTEMRETVVANLRALGVSQAKIDAVLSVEHPYIDFDHASFVTNAVDTTSFNVDTTAAWNEFFSPDIRKGFGCQPSPDELEAFLAKWNLITGEVNERLTDYRHYLATRTHRRPDAWKAGRG